MPVTAFAERKKGLMGLPTRGQASDVMCLVLPRERSAMPQEAARWRQAAGATRGLLADAGAQGSAASQVGGKGRSKRSPQPTRELTNHNFRKRPPIIGVE